MKKSKIIVTVLGVLVLLGGLVAGVLLSQQRQNLSKRAAPASTMYVDPASISKAPDESFSFAVKIDTATNVMTGFDIHMTFDPAALEVISVDKGSQVADFTTPVVNTAFNNTAGTIASSYITVDTTKAITGSGITILTVNAKVKSGAASGTYNLGFDSSTMAIALDETQNILISKNPGTLTVTTGASALTTEPTATANSTAASLAAGSTATATATATSASTGTPQAPTVTTSCSGTTSLATVSWTDADKNLGVIVYVNDSSNSWTAENGYWRSEYTYRNSLSAIIPNNFNNAFKTTEVMPALNPNKSYYVRFKYSDTQTYSEEVGFTSKDCSGSSAAAITPTVTATPTIASGVGGGTSATKTPTPKPASTTASLPETGTSLPTIGALLLGTLVIIGSLLLAL